MCVYIIIATIRAAVLWQVDSAAALKCNGYGLESSLAGHLDKGSVHWKKVGIDRGPGQGCQFLPQTGPGRGDYQKWPGPGIIKQTINFNNS